MITDPSDISVAPSDGKYSKTEIIIPNGSSNAKAVFNLVMTAIGLGVMTLPMAFGRAGWISGSILLVISAGFVYYNVIILCHALCLNPEEPGRVIQSFEELGRICYGRLATVMNSLTLHPLLIAACAVFLILLSTSLYNMTGVLSYNLWLLIIALCIAPFACLRTMKEVGVLSAIGVASVAAIVVLVVLASLDRYINGASESLGEPQEEVTYILSGNPVQLIAVFCTFLLSYNVSITVPTIIKDVERPQTFPKVAWISFIIVGAVYFAITIAGYLAFGESISKYDTMVEAFTPRNRADWTVYSWLINASTIVLVSTHFLVLFSPTAQLSDTLLQVDNTKRWRSPWVAEVARCCCRVALVVVCALIALLVPSVDKLVNLLSAVFVVLIALVYPTVYYWRILNLNGIKQSIWKVWFQRALMVVALVALVFGTYLAIRDFL